MSKNFSREQILQAIENSAGIVLTIAKRLSCDWHTAQAYIEKWEGTRAAYQDECEKVLDLAETKMIEVINTGDGPMIRYLLSTKGKSRGYTEKQEHEISTPEGKPIRVIHDLDLSKLSTDDLLALKRISERTEEGSEPED